MSRESTAGKILDSTAAAVASGQSPGGKAIWSIGGGKGGIGKSFLSSSLAIYLAQVAHKVVIIDLDLGGANLHTCLGVDIPQQSLSDFLAGRVTNINDIIVESGVRNLKFISGANDALNVANISEEQKLRLMEAIRTIDAEYVLIDLGAGTTELTLDFFLMAQKSIVVTTPLPTSIENAYRFIKSALYRKMRLVERAAGVEKIVEEAMDHRNKLGIRSPADLVRHVVQRDPAAGQIFMSELHNFKLNLIINEVRTRADVDLGYNIQSVCRRYFGVETEFTGFIDYDNAVWQSLRKKRPLILEYPHSLLVGQLSSITKNLIDPKRVRGVL